jgi:hypothetical protein
MSSKDIEKKALQELEWKKIWLFAKNYGNDIFAKWN